MNHSSLIVVFFVVMGFVGPSEASITINGLVVARANATTFNTLTTNGTDAVAVEIFDKMAATVEVFAFDTVDHAASHFQVRKEVIKAIGQMRAGGPIDFSYADGAQVFPAGLVRIPGANPNHFQTDLLFPEFLTPADAILRIEQGRTRTECTTALHSAMAIGHRRALGNIRVNRILLILEINGKMGAFVNVNPADADTIIPGDARYMMSHPQYDALAKANGVSPREWSGENCVYVGNDKYTGLGSSMQNQTEVQMKQTLLKNFNNETRLADRMRLGIDNDVLREAIKFTTLGRVRIQSR